MHVIIGDIHGCLHTLKALLKRTGKHNVISVGDVVDKGLWSVECVDLLRSIGATLVVGNHDHCMIRAMIQGKPQKYKESEIIAAGLSRENIEYLVNSTYAKIFERGVVVHGGILPGTTLEQLIVAESMTIRDFRDKHDFVNKIMRVKAVDPDGKFVSMKYDDAGNLLPFVGDPWENSYDGRFGNVYYGHDPKWIPDRPWEHCFGLDTGACYNNGLTAAIVDKQGNFLSYIFEPTHELDKTNKIRPTRILGS